MARERERNNNSSEADTISIGEIVTGNLFNVADQDYFRFFVNEASRIKFILTDNQESTPADFTRSEGSWDISIISANKAEIINGYNNIDRNNPDGTTIVNYIIESGWYYIIISQDYRYNHTDTDYEFKLTQEKGFLNFGYEGNDSISQATELKFENGKINKVISNNYTIASDGWVFSNLYHVTRDEHVNYGSYDKDYFKFNLSEGSNEIVISFDTLGGDDYYLNNWQFSLYDSDGYLIQGKDFYDNGSFTVSTKSSGDFYLKITQDDWDRVDPSLFKFKITTSNSSDNIIQTSNEETNSNSIINNETDSSSQGGNVSNSPQSQTQTISKYFESSIDYEVAIERSTIEHSGGTINYSRGNDVIVISSGITSYRGLKGDDIYLITDLIPNGPKPSQIIDTEGNNIIQIPSSTYIESILFDKTALKMTLSDTQEIIISAADKMIFNVGANITSGITSDDLTFSQFANLFGIDDVSNLTSLENIQVDMYVI